MNWMGFAAAVLLPVAYVQAITYGVTATGPWEDAANWNQPVAPTNDPAAVIQAASGRTITLSSAALISNLVLNDGDAATVSAVIDGGMLRSDKDGVPGWNAIGYNKSASLTLRNGGSWICDGRIEVGLFEGADDQVCVFTMEPGSGDVTVSNDFFLGRNFAGAYSNVSAQAYIKGGTVNVGGAFSIDPDGDNFVDIHHAGKLVVSGNVTNLLNGYVADEILLGNGQTNNLEIVYDGTNTTVSSVPPGYDYTVKETGFWNDDANWNANTGSGTVNAAPIYDPAAVVKSKSGKTITLTSSAVIGKLNLNDGDASTVSLVIDGGALRSNNGSTEWNAIGYNKSASLIITNGGSWECDGRIEVGQFDSVNGQLNTFTMEQDSGDVTTSGDFYVGRNFDASHSASARAFIKGGTLSVGGNLWIAADSAYSMDLSGDAVVLIDGDKSADIQNFIIDGRITAFGGSGTPIVDYNSSHTGKTTIKAYDGLLDPQWQVAAATYSTNQLIITPYDAGADFGIVADGVTDVTAEIQEALIVIGNLGGGTLFLPEGFYKVSGNLIIPPGVTLHGDWQQPVPGQPISGTVLQAYAGRDDTNAPPFISLSKGAAVNGLAVWYPEQLPTDIRPYPVTIGNGGWAAAENITFVNSYFGYTCYREEGVILRPFVRNIYGTPLKIGIEFDNIVDIGRLETVHFSPDFWAGSGLANAPTAGQHEAWIYNNGTGLLFGRLDWSYSCYATVEGYQIGLALRPSRYDAKVPNGQSYGFNLIDCKYGVYVESSAYAGYQFTRFHIQGAETGVYLSPDQSETVMLNDCEIEASGAALLCAGSSTARAMIMSCDFQQGAVRMDSGYLSVINSDFSSSGVDIVLESAVRGASVLGNRFEGPARIVDHTDYPVEIDHAPLALSSMPAYDYKQPAKAYRPATTNLYIVTEAPFNAVADGSTDNTAAFSNALAAASAVGGGTVYVPAGTYRLDGTLTIPTGVELRGTFEGAHDNYVKGSLLNVYSGRNEVNGTPFIQLESGSGLKGFNFHYPEQIFDVAETNMYGFVPYPALIRGLGSDVYIVNVGASIPYQMIDLASVPCDRHYVDGIFGTALKTGIHVGGGSTDGQLHNIQFQSWSYIGAWKYYDSIPQGTKDYVQALLMRDATHFLFGNMTNEIVHQCFVFTADKGVHLVEENGTGPSGHCLGLGADSCTTALRVDAVGAGGFDPINTQLVVIDDVKGVYIETDASLTDELRLFGCAAWGKNEYAAVLNGGTIELQNVLLQRDGTGGTYQILNNATVKSYGGSMDFFQSNPFLTIDAGASALFAGNVLNISAAQMPADSANVTAIGNLRMGAPNDDTSTSYDAWALAWGVNIGSDTDDYDGDLLNNFYEYAVGGDPTNAADYGRLPTLGNKEGSLFYVHPQHNDDDTLMYTVETRTNLLSGTWAPSGYNVLGTNGTDAAYVTVTNSFPVNADQTFFRLHVEQK